MNLYAKKRIPPFVAEEFVSSLELFTSDWYRTMNPSDVFFFPLKVLLIFIWILIFCLPLVVVRPLNSEECWRKCAFLPFCDLAFLGIFIIAIYNSVWKSCHAVVEILFGQGKKQEVYIYIIKLFCILGSRPLPSHRQTTIQRTTTIMP